MATQAKLSDLIPSRFAHLTPPSEENIERIRADLETGSKILLNNPHVFKNESGKWELLAGHDRAEAARRAGWDVIPVRDFTGTLNGDDAVFSHFCKENLLRKDVSKAAVAGEWLKRHPDWSDGKISDESGCTQRYVGDVRSQLVASGDMELVPSREGRDGRTTKAERPARTPSATNKPKHEAPEDMAAQITRAAAERTNPTPEPTSSTDHQSDDEGSQPESGSEVGVPTGALPTSDEPATESSWLQQEKRAALRAVEATPWGRVSKWLERLPIPEKWSADEVREAAREGLPRGSLVAAKYVHQVLGVILTEADRKESSNAAA